MEKQKIKSGLICAGALGAICIFSWTAFGVQPATLIHFPITTVEPSRSPANVAEDVDTSLSQDQDGKSPITVYSVDPGLRTQALTEAGYEIHHAGNDEQREVPVPQRRDRIFQDAGLGSFIGKLDAVDRDVLYLRAKDRPFLELRDLYPSFPVEGLKRLQRAVGRSR